MNCDNCMLVEALKTKIKAQQHEIDIMNREEDGVIAICDLILTAVEAWLKDCASSAEAKKTTEKTSDALKQVSVLANSIGKAEESVGSDRLAAFLDTVMDMGLTNQ